ncbi:helix-turn-helix domain-containing protein [Ensifer sp. B1-9]|uniref:helix-turn-helix domain-containing protein n=1 Tax=Ensifer sp. B1-9 TaxID=3141455 RepID=UPI003D1E76DB
MALHEGLSAGDRTSRPTVKKISAGEITVTRTFSDRFDLERGPMIPVADAFNVIVQMRDFEAHRLWRRGELVYEGGHSKASLAITDLRDQWQCHHLSPFDNVRFHIPFSCMRTFTERAGRGEYVSLSPVQGQVDPVMFGLAQALLPSLDEPDRANLLFVEQINLAALAHLSQTYGGLHFPVDKKGTLAPWQEKQATEFLVAHFNKAFSIGDLAAQCALSRSYFNKAFKESFGRTPSRWLTEYRIARVKECLLQDTPLAEVAIHCGFADQSHMTRVFTSQTGETPARFRKKNRSVSVAADRSHQ